MLFVLYAKATYFFKDFWLYLILILLSFFAFLIVLAKNFRSESAQTRKMARIMTFFLLFAIILTFSLFEAYFRYVYDESDGLGFLMVDKRWHARHVVFNNYFFRGPDLEVNKKEGTKRICAIGDSITFGGGIKNVDDRFTNILEEKLKEQGANAEVYNMGRSGYNTKGEIADYERIKHLSCDIIIWQYFLNDIQHADKSTATPILISQGRQYGIVKALSDRSFFFDFLYWRYTSRYKDTFVAVQHADLDAYKNEPVFNEHKQDIESFVKKIKEEEKKPIIVIIFPFVHLLPSYPADDVHQKMGQIFRDAGAETIDFLDYLKDKNGQDLIASRFDNHPNEYVHALAAEKLLEKVAPLVK